MLFKEEVRVLDENFTAGCERMFIYDLIFLNSKEYLKSVYTTAKNNLFSVNKKKLHTIPYPHDLIPFLYKIFRKFRISKSVSDLVFRFTECVLQLYYTSIFLIKEFRSDLFYVYQVPLVGLFFPQKTVVAYHNFCPHLDFIFKLLFLVQKKASNIRFIFVSDSLCKHFFHEYPSLKRCRCHILYNAVDSVKFKQKQKELKVISFVFLSSWIREKGIYLLPNIIRRINKFHLNKVRFIIGGSSKLWSMADWEYLAYNTIQNKIIKLEKEFANVKVIGNVNYELIPDILGRSTYCLLPSVWAEPFSLLMVESLSCGTPVIAYRVGGNTEIIKNGKNGYLINEINYLSLFKLLNHIINNFSWNEYMKMSHNARLESEKYSLARRNKRLLVILRGR